MGEERGLAALRAPTALARTDELPSLRRPQRAGIVGVALGFGSQNLVRDFISGIFMLLEDQYGVGDVVDAGRPPAPSRGWRSSARAGSGCGWSPRPDR